MKYTLWDSQPTELKLGVVGFGLASAGMLGGVFASDPVFRRQAIQSLQDINLVLPLSLLPYHEYFGLSSFKYKLPSAEFAPYTFETEFALGAFFDLLPQKWNLPRVDH